MPTQTAPSSPPTTPPAVTGARAWLPVGALSLGIAILVASEFLPAGVLPALAADVGVSEGTAGLAVAATAIAGAFTAPSIAVLLPRADRRLVLLGLLLAAALSNLAVAVAPGFAVVLVGRLLLGVAIAGYWSLAFGAGVHAAPGRQRLVASALAFGTSVATVVGVPLASVVGDTVGWRTAFGGAAVLSLLSAVALAVALPSVPAHPTAGLRMLREALRNRLLMAGIGFVVLVAFGNFAAYPYIRLAIDRVDPGATTWMLLAWGVGGVVGPILAGVLARWLRPLTAAAPFGLAVALLLTAVAPSVPVLTVAVVLWGVSLNAVPAATQLWVARAEPVRTESAISLQVTAFQVAITAGSALGGVLLDGYGVRPLLVIGAGAAVAAGLGWAFVRLPRA
ncbi:MFS transporter [Promicromonospora thailandica]|uniref:MFS transporter, DHA1 family, purine ribonucleoside efflux pump n=1 Tax=Promicromonospora thailandica TaxID=765201 RepID=A0A9X2G629_9MICO|nr:MFS transporter [Promicromonospora thailandica]MCP2263216.1 MFS transporter, DHA1 family, purine ribonucleoside efflux pump [Promicromonospora thailandica]